MIGYVAAALDGKDGQAVGEHVRARPSPSERDNMRVFDEYDPIANHAKRAGSVKLPLQIPDLAVLTSAKVE
jgi:hypothetical protein